MADFSALKTSIQNYIKQNGNEEITGNLLQQVLLSMVTTLGDSAINDLVTALNAEIANRGNADTTLQGNINSEATTRANADTELGGRITTLQGVVNGIKSNVENGYVYAGIATPSTTPVSGKVFYLALNAGTYTNFGATVVPQGINILKYNGSAWSLDSFLGLDDTPTQGSNNLVKSGGVLDSIIKDGSAFDLSAYNSGATYADLSAALTALNALPAAYKKGGMSFKYVQSSDNKYVQFRCMAQNFTTDVTQWQGVDDEPTAGSDNLVKSGGVFAELLKIKNGITYNSSILTENAYYYINKSMDGHFPGDTPTTLQNYYCVQIPIFVGDILIVTSSTYGNSNALAYGIYSNIGKQLECETYNSEVNTFTLNIKQDGYIRINCLRANLSIFKVIKYNGTQKNDYLFSMIQKILCAGDSMTDGYMWNDTDNEYQVHREYSYPTILTKLTNVETVNEGHSGITAKGWYDAFGELDFSTCDYAFIFLGKNGGLTDTLATDVYPYADYHDYADTNTGCYCKIIQSLKAKRANVKIVLINGLTLDFTTQNVINFIGEHYNIPVISLDDDSIYDLSNFDVYHHKDTTHFNAIGYATLAKYLLYKVANTIRLNYSIYDNGN